MWMQETKSGSPARAASVFDCAALSPGPTFIYSSCVKIVGISVHHHVGPGFQTQVIRLGDKCPYSLSHLASPILLKVIFKRLPHKLMNFKAEICLFDFDFCHYILHIGILRPTSNHSRFHGTPRKFLVCSLLLVSLFKWRNHFLLF